VRLLRNGEVTMLRGHRDDVTSAAFSPSGELLLTGSKDNTSRIWDVATGELLRTFTHNSAVQDAQFSPDGRWVVTAPLRASIWEADDPTIILRLQGHEGPVTAAAFTPDGRTVVTGGVDGVVRTYRCELCDGIDELVTMADERLRATGRELTPAERARYLD
jgi:WD40 repeat protein